MREILLLFEALEFFFVDNSANDVVKDNVNRRKIRKVKRGHKNSTGTSNLRSKINTRRKKNRSGNDGTFRICS